MATPFLLPALSANMDKATVARWRKAEGDTFEAGDVILEVETDKATLEVEAPGPGTLGAILVPAGTMDVPVETPVAMFLAMGETSSVTSKMNPVEEFSSTAAAPAADGRILASPIARRVAREAGLSLTALQGTGPKGRIIEADVRAALNRARLPVDMPAASPNAAAPQRERSSADLDDTARAYADVPHRIEPADAMRRTIAERLTSSKQTVPHFYLDADIDMTGLVALRRLWREEAGTDRRIPTVNDVVVKAAAFAFAEVPEANAIWSHRGIMRFERVDIGVAVSVDGGLFTPVVRDAGSLSIGAISSRLASLVEAARERRLRPDEYSGGVASVSNLGMMGVTRFAAIVNPPQSAIFAVGAVTDRLVPRDGAPTLVPIMSVMLSVDHRVLDGVLAAALLNAFRRGLERPATTLL